MNNVLLIRPHVALDDTQSYATESPPIGIISLGSFLRSKGLAVTAVGLCIDTKIDIIYEIAKIKPDIIGISSMTCDFPSALKMANQIKQHFNIPLVLGGAHPTIFPKEVLYNTSIDFVIMGEGEYAFYELIEALRESKEVGKVASLGYKQNGSIFISQRRPPLDMSVLPFPDYSLLDNEKYISFGEKYLGFRHIVMIVSRGCPGRCTFCAQNLTWGRQFRAFPPDRLVAEIKKLMSRYNVEGVWFKDSTLTTSKKWITEFCEQVGKQKLDFKWSCFTRVDQVDREIIRNMKKAGLVKLWIGAESGSNRILQLLKKDITVDITRQAFQICKEEGVDTAAFFMFGLPTETVEEMELTFELACELDARPLHLAIYHPLPGTELYETYNGAEVLKHASPRDMAFDRACMSTGHVSKELVQEIYDSVCNYFIKNGPRPDFKEFKEKASSWEVVV
jgi:radical SAM superfamily enzyme YgiQ (UPF0313 family)